MESRKSLILFLFFLLLGFSSSSFISNDDAVASYRSVGRSLLQQKKSCPVDLENMNYTTVTSQCKGPNYMPERCCMPLKQLMCPVKDAINDLTTTCADTFFSYVNLYGKYPPGLFSALCKDDKEGLDCSDVVEGDSVPDRNNNHPNTALSSLVCSKMQLLVTALWVGFVMVVN